MELFHSMNLALPVITTQRLTIRLATHYDIPGIVHYYVENQAYLVPFEPARPDYFLTEHFWQGQIDRDLMEFNYKQSLRLFVFKRSASGQEMNPTVIGAINFTQLIEGISYFCYLGYSLAEVEQGNGYMTEALKPTIQYVFDTLKLHRIMANYMPHNRRSGNVLKRLGFVIEGYARDYLLINGKWEDHILTSLINPNWRTVPPAAGSAMG